MASMELPRKAVYGVLVVGSILAAVALRRRARRAVRAANAHPFVSRRAVDREARDQQALERRGSEGGAMEGDRDEIVR